jgi:hypothetical protein
LRIREQSQASFSSSKKKHTHTHTQRKKNHREEKKCKEGRELSFKLSFCPFTSALLFQTLSPDIFFFSSRRKEKKTPTKKNP